MNYFNLHTQNIIFFEHLRASDVDIVGGKNASLGELISQLSQAGVRVPKGFATTASAFKAFLSYNCLTDKIKKILETLNPEDTQALVKVGATIRQWIIDAPLQSDLDKDIRQAFSVMVGNQSMSVAVRSSATAEDLPDASFAGQQESYLNVVGIDEVLDKVKRVFASLYNDRAIAYRVHKGFSHTEVALSVGIQQMVRSDSGSSGVMFTIDTESGLDSVVLITSSYGLGETIVQGAVNPDEFYVHKPILKAGKYPIIRRNIGSKLIQMVFTPDNQVAVQGRVKTIEVPIQLRNRYSLSDTDIIQLAQYAVIIEQHYGRPMDIEWGKDGLDGQLYILQARPETVKSQLSNNTHIEQYRLKHTTQTILPLITGRAIGQKIGSGRVRVVLNPDDMHWVQSGDVLVADMTDPNWEPIMKRASAIVTNRGGRTCHAAIIARELGIPAVVGCGQATELLKDGTLVTVSCAEGDEGKVYHGLLDMQIEHIQRTPLPKIATKIMMNVGNPQLAFDFCQLPNAGVGLARLEFIINNNIGIHPKAILDYPQVDSTLKKAIDSIARGHQTPQSFFIDKITEGVATIAAAFWPKPVIVRLSDFKSNEYRKLIGGSRYEPEEENPMLGFRGASRYISSEFSPCFALECEAMRFVRHDMGLNNVELMIPFVRTLNEAAAVIDLLAQHGLKRGENGLKIIMMCEVPSNALLAEEFLEYFDGFSIGSNDLTQLTLGLDRDSGLVSTGFDERDPAVMLLLERAINACKKAGKYVGICGQGPSDHLDLAQWLMEKGISSISLNPDTVIQTWSALSNSNAVTIK